MKPNTKNVFLLALAVSCAICSAPPISAITNSKSSNSKVLTAHKHKDKKSVITAKEAKSKKKELGWKTKQAEQVAAEETLPGPGQDKLTQAAQAYQNKPDENTYIALWDNFVTFTQQTTAKHKDPVHLFRSWKVLSDAGLKIIDASASNYHIYSFNRITLNNNSFVPQAKSALIQWSDQIAILPTAPASSLHSGRHKKARAKVVKTVAVIKTQIINIPSYVELKEAALLQRGALAIKSKGKKVNLAAAPAAGRYLALAGVDTQSSHTWLFGLHNVGSNWIHYPELFQDVPPFLVQSSSAKTKLTNSSLVITIGGSGGYDLVMPWVDGHFAFSTREAQDSASAVAHQFLLALQYKRIDLAKVWLADPKLASIPGYLGLFNRATDAAALKLIAMSPPISGGARFRLITSTKDDLIIDVARTKAQLLIRGIFIAPAVTRQLSANSPLVAPTSAANVVGVKAKQIGTQ